MRTDAIVVERRGFTLIELLVVIAIIGLLASSVLANISSARTKARDSKRVSDFRAMSLALKLYYEKYNRYPNETPVMTNPWSDNFTSAAQQLVTEGFLTSVPIPPAPYGYSYYNYGGPIIGALLVTQLETAPPSSTGVPPSCRPWAAGTNWCSASVDNLYCICNPYQ